MAHRYKVPPIQVGNRRTWLPEQIYPVFEAGPTADEVAHEREVQELYEQVGRQKVENGFLKKTTLVS